MSATPPPWMPLAAPGSAPGDDASFLELLRSRMPEALARPVTGGLASEGLPERLPHATTIVAARSARGAVIAADRRATAGNVIARHDMDKLYPVGSHAVLGTAGTAGPAIDLARLFRIELEHYEKIEGRPLSVTGTANRLGAIVRARLDLAMSGLPVVPLLVAYDDETRMGRLFSYDLAGGAYEERDHHAIGSGAVYARGSLKKTWREGQDENHVALAVLRAVSDAAEDDSATGGIDRVRGIYPTVAVVDADGVRVLTDPEVAHLADRLAAGAEGDR